MKKFTLLSFVTVLVATLCYSPEQKVQAEEGISLEVAKQAALNKIEQSIFAAEVDEVDDFSLKTYLYDVDDSLLGYYLTYNTSEGNTNHILISATDNVTPVLRYGEGLLDYEYDYLLDEGKKLYYLGPLQFLYGKDKEEVNEKFNKRKTIWVKDLERQNKKLSKEYEKLKNREIPRIKKNKKHKDEWNQLLTTDTTNQITAAASSYRLLSVTHVWQRSPGVNNPDSACGPATAAMVANYLKGQGYNVKGISNYSSVGSFIDHMDNDLGTTAIGSSISQYVSGLNRHLEENYSNNKWETWTIRAYGNYSEYKASINDNKPVGLRFDFFVSESAYSNHHFVVGTGYDHGSTAEFGLKDPDLGKYGTGTSFEPWNDNNDDMAMGLVDNRY